MYSFIFERCEDKKQSFQSIMQTITHNILYSPVIWEFENKESFAFTVARLDLLHPFISGNKYFKLKYNLEQAIREQKQGILTMGGAYSNHLAATAFACNEKNLHSIGIIRGELMEPLNPTLSFCKEHGMRFISVSRSEYDSKSPTTLDIIAAEKDFFFVPEGGNNNEGLAGCKEILMQMKDASSFTHIVCSMGTGTTFKGIAAAATEEQTVIGIPALKIKTEEQQNFQLQHAAANTKAKTLVLFEHAGAGYARADESLFNFMNLFYTKTVIPTDIVYTGKLMQAVVSLAAQHFFPPESKVLVIHSGGLQGNNSLPANRLLF